MQVLVDIVTVACFFEFQVRRCHLNDMENVYLFVLMSLLYIGTNPVYSTALLLFRVSYGAAKGVVCPK